MVGRKLVVALAVALTAVTGAAAAPKPLDPSTRFFVPAPSAGALRQVAGLVAHGQLGDAVRVGSMLAQGHAVWFTKGTAAEVRRDVRSTMAQASLERRVPVLVAYDLPFRDCGQYSAGGALRQGTTWPGSTASPAASVTARPS